MVFMITFRDRPKFGFPRVTAVILRENFHAGLYCTYVTATMTLSASSTDWALLLHLLFTNCQSLHDSILNQPFMALDSLWCANVPLKNCLPTHAKTANRLHTSTANYAFWMTKSNLGSIKGTLYTYTVPLCRTWNTSSSDHERCLTTSNECAS